MSASVALRVETVPETELTVYLPDDVCRAPGFYHRLLRFLEHDSSPQQRTRRRDALIRQLAAEFYVGTPRARAIALLADAKRYETTAWKVDVRSASCPEKLRGTPRELLWYAFKSARRFPGSVRQLQNIIR
jgi:hypothetical protein